MERSAKQGNVRQIGIITWHYYSNYGSSLQAYAMQHTLNKMGYDAILINYRNPSFGIERKASHNIRILLAETLGRLHNSVGARFAYPHIRFQYENLNQTNVVYAREDIPNVLEGIKTIVCGSDQIWAPNALDTVYMADFADRTKVKKVAYAASIGLRDIPEEKKHIYVRYLHDFSAIAVRESAGKDILSNLGIQSEVTLDPTLLLETREYDKLAKKPRICTKSKYIFCYFLNENNRYRDIVLKFARDRNLQILGKSSNPADTDWVTQLEAVGPSEFLWLISHAEFVFTDSYHGTIFSLLYHKQFYMFRRFADGDPIDQNSRIEQLCNYFEFENRIISADSEYLTDEKYDFIAFETVLAGLRKDSLRYLENALRD